MSVGGRETRPGVDCKLVERFCKRKSQFGHDLIACRASLFSVHLIPLPTSPIGTKGRWVALRYTGKALKALKAIMVFQRPDLIPWLTPSTGIVAPSQIPCQHASGRT